MHRSKRGIQFMRPSSLPWWLVNHLPTLYHYTIISAPPPFSFLLLFQWSLKSYFVATTHWTGTATSENWTPRQKVQFWNVLVCSAGKVCCQNAYTGPNCCNDSSLLLEFSVGMPSPLAVASSSHTAIATSPSSTTVATSSPIAIATCSHTTGARSNMSQITVVGVAVGVPLGVLLASAVAALFFLLCSRQKPKFRFGRAQYSGKTCGVGRDP